MRLRLSYDGGAYHGWQVQPGRATVQGAVMAALAAVTGEPLTVHGSGRTDAGVHALGQVAHLQLLSRLPPTNLLRALNVKLPRDIRVLAIDEVATDFDARRHALSKLYRYRIYRAPVCPPFLRGYVYHHPYPLDERAMIVAAPGFEGQHDFRSFAATGDKRHLVVENTVRTVLASTLRREADELIYDVRGRGFLHHMVRNLVGFLLAVGRGTRQGTEIAAVLAATQRSAAAATAPPQGLYLVEVTYADAAAVRLS